LVLPIIAYTLFNKSRDKGKIVSAWKRGSKGEDGGGGIVKGEGRGKGGEK
jgi:hypothetical protein